MNSEDLPESPMTALAEGAAQIHEMYQAYMDAGFPEHRAFELVKILVTGMMDNQ